MVDKAVLAKRVAAIRDAVGRIRETLPGTVDAFVSNRTSREVITFNLFLAVQESISLATHWLADEGWDVPLSYGEAFTVLAEHGVLERELASRLSAAAGLRNLIAHQYGVLDFQRIFATAANDIEDLLTFCQQLAQRAEPT